MGLIDAATAPLRYVMGSAEHGVAADVRDLEHLQMHVVSAVEALKDATEQIEAHVEVIESLATSLVPLTEAVVALTAQMAVITEVLAPLAGAEHEVTKVGSLFTRHKHHPAQ